MKLQPPDWNKVNWTDWLTAFAVWLFILVFALNLGRYLYG